MWKSYSRDFVKGNSASGLTVAAAAFISSLFLSLLCCLFYNFWIYEAEQVVLEEGDWQGRITGQFTQEDPAVIESVIERFANVREAAVNTELSDEENTVVDVYFENARSIYQDLPAIGRRLGLSEEGLKYHERLLSRYLIHDPSDSSPPLLLSFYLAVLFVMCVSLIIIIHNAFALSMDARVRQLGILSSIGATPGQLRIGLLQEAAALCLAPLFCGTLAGIGLSAGILQRINIWAADVPGRHSAEFQYHPLVLGLTLLVSVLTVLISADIPARKLSRLTPLEALRNAEPLKLKRKKHSRFLEAVFGIEGELAGNALRAQKKALRTSSLSLTLSSLGFVMMLCFFTLSDISTRHTYFERYQDAWDVMVTIPHEEVGSFSKIQEIRELSGVRDVVFYQKALAQSVLPEKEIRSPLVIMDDESFLKYCEQAGGDGGLFGTIVLNRVWDRENSNFRYKEYIPLLEEEPDTILLRLAEGEESAELPVLAYTTEPPVLREEYEDGALVQFLSASAWERLKPRLGNGEEELYIRILAGESVRFAEGETALGDTAGLAEANALQAEVMELLKEYEGAESENRIWEKVSDKRMKEGMMLIFGGLCVLLALIGVANVFSYTLGFLRQRKREFAQYLSVGMTPGSMRKLFFIEALVLVGRPFLITLPLSVLISGWMVRASYLEPAEFLGEAPFIPAAIFFAAVAFSVLLAYIVGGRRMMRCSLSEALKDDRA